MAWNEDGQRILGIGRTDSADGFGVSNLLCELAVGDGFAVGNFLQIFPDALLKVGSVHKEWDFKFVKSAGEIFLKLTRNFDEKGAILFPIFVRNFILSPAEEPDSVQATFVCNEAERTDGSFLHRGEICPHSAILLPLSFFCSHVAPVLNFA